jgi:hypothetical protein
MPGGNNGQVDRRLARDQRIDKGGDRILLPTRRQGDLALAAQHGTGELRLPIALNRAAEDAVEAAIPWQARQGEIDETEAARAVDQYVSWMHIAVKDSLAMQAGIGFRDRKRELNHVGFGTKLIRPLALLPGKRDPRHFLRHAGIQEGGRHGSREPGQHLRFACDQPSKSMLHPERTQPLDGGDSLTGGRAIDLGIVDQPDTGLDAPAPEVLARPKQRRERRCIVGPGHGEKARPHHPLQEGKAFLQQGFGRLATGTAQSDHGIHDPPWLPEALQQPRPIGIDRLGGVAAARAVNHVFLARLGNGVAKPRGESAELDDLYIFGQNQRGAPVEAHGKISRPARPRRLSQPSTGSQLAGSIPARRRRSSA